jgi:hypothetical protein
LYVLCKVNDTKSLNPKKEEEEEEEEEKNYHYYYKT